MPVEVLAMPLNGYGDFIRARDWINGNGGSAVFAEAAEFNGHRDYLIVSTPEGNAEAGEGWYVVRDVLGNFYPCEPRVFELSHELIPDSPTFDENLTGTGMYVRGRPDGRTSLVGGAALPLPT